MRRITSLAVAAALALPATASAHVTVHPNVIPEGSFAVLDIRVPNERDDAGTTKVQVQLPDGFAFLSAEVPPGWKVAYKNERPADPVQTPHGEIPTQFTEVTFSGGLIPPGQFREFPVSVLVPGEAGDTLTFKSLQTYENGEVVRWIGEPDSEKPAPTITISDAGGLIEDSTGGAGHAEDASHEGEGEPAPAASTTRVVEKESKGLSIAALILGALGLATGGLALTRKKG